MKENNNLDKIHIRDLSLQCIIGINDNERVEKQEVIINISLFVDMKNACISDNIDNAVNYKKVKQSIVSLVEKSSFFLVEKLAEEIANLCLSNPGVEIVNVVLDKPGALRFAKSVAVEITRYKND